MSGEWGECMVLEEGGGYDHFVNYQIIVFGWRDYEQFLKFLNSVKHRNLSPFLAYSSRHLTPP